MKRLFIIFLSLLYVVMSSGFTTYTHFCKGKQQGTALYNGDQFDGPCPICLAKDKKLKEKKKGCCKHEAKAVKTDNLTKNDQSFKFASKLWGDTIPNRTIGALFDFPLITKDLENPNNLSSKIPIRSNPLFILHCVYRI